MARPAGANAATDAIRDTRRESLNMIDVCDDAGQLRTVIAVRDNLLRRVYRFKDLLAFIGQESQVYRVKVTTAAASF